MKRPVKSIETSRSVMHQKTGVVLSQNRRLGIPTMRFNHVNGDLFAQQHPQILRPCAYSPAGVVQPYHGALPQLTLQLLVRWGLLNSPVAPRPGTPRSGSTSARSPVPAPAPCARAAAQFFIEHGRHRQGCRSYLYLAHTEGIGGLQGMSALRLPSAASTPPHLYVKAADDGHLS